MSFIFLQSEADLGLLQHGVLYVNSYECLIVITIVTKHSILDVAAALDPPLTIVQQLVKSAYIP